MIHHLLWLLAASLSHVAHARSRHISHRKECAPFDSGTIIVDSYQLYPENADFDLNQCLLYFGYVVSQLMRVRDVACS